MELFFSAIGLGIMLSFVFIGPIFFLLIETSFSRSPRHAAVLDLGVILADIVCIVAAYYASSDLVHLIDSHPSFYRITALLAFVYGIIMVVTKTKMHVKNEEKIISQSYLRTFINGFLFNILNIGVVLFWIVTVISVRSSYPKPAEFILYISIVLSTYLLLDLLKILLAKQFHYKLTQKVANTLRRGVGIVLMLFGIFIFLQSFKNFNQFERQLEQVQKSGNSQSAHLF